MVESRLPWQGNPKAKATRTPRGQSGLSGCIFANICIKVEVVKWIVRYLPMVRMKLSYHSSGFLTRRTTFASGYLRICWCQYTAAGKSHVERYPLLPRMSWMSAPISWSAIRIHSFACPFSKFSFLWKEFSCNRLPREGQTTYGNKVHILEWSMLSGRKCFHFCPRHIRSPPLCTLETWRRFPAAAV